MNAKPNKLQIIVLAPVIAGIALIVAGIVNDRGDLLTAGIAVLFGGSFFVAVITCTITIVCATRSNTYSKAESRDDYIDSVRSKARERAIQKAGGMSAETDAALKKIEDSVRKRKRAERFTKFLGALFVVAFISFLFGGMGLMIAGNLVAGGIVFACGPAMILISFIVVQIKAHVVRSDEKLSDRNYRRKVGRVTECAIKRYTPSMLYRIELEVNGKAYATDSEQAYSVGEKVEVTVYNSGKFGSIIGPTEYSFVRAKADNIHKESAEKAETAKRSEPIAETSLSAPLAATPSVQADEKETEARTVQNEQRVEKRYGHTPPTGKRPTVGYKGINRNNTITNTNNTEVNNAKQ